MIHDRAMMVFLHCFFLGGVSIGEVGLLGDVLVVFLLLLQVINHCSGTFFCNFFLSCASIMSLWYCVVAEAG
jgi:hypothetical protein